MTTSGEPPVDEIDAFEQTRLEPVSADAAVYKDAHGQWWLQGTWRIVAAGYPEKGAEQ